MHLRSHNSDRHSSVAEPQLVLVAKVAGSLRQFSPISDVAGTLVWRVELPEGFGRRVGIAVKESDTQLHGCLIAIDKAEGSLKDGTHVPLSPSGGNSRIEDSQTYLLDQERPTLWLASSRLVVAVTIQVRVLTAGRESIILENHRLKEELQRLRTKLNRERHNTGEQYRNAAKALRRVAELEKQLVQERVERAVLADSRARLEQKLVRACDEPGRAIENKLRALPVVRGLSFLDTSAREEERAAYLERLIAGSGIFDPGAYVNYYPDVMESGLDPFDHFMRHGLFELRRPGPRFDPIYYLSTYTDVRECNPLIHYLEYGRTEGRRGYFGVGPDHNVPVLREALFQSGTMVAEHRSFYGHLEFGTKYPQREMRPVSVELKASRLDIHWVIPDFSAGMGGHMTIFRMVRYLEEMGHQQTIWLRSPARRRSEAEVQREIRQHFQPTSPRVRFLEDAHPDTLQGDVVIATDRWTAYPVASMANFKARFYLVQDYEPYFYPVGAEYYLAEQTYKLGLDCLVCSKWLDIKMREFNAWTSRWYLAYDSDVYTAVGRAPESGQLPRIAFYARHATARRCVELGMLALDELWREGHFFHVDFFGAEHLDFQAEYPHRNHGLLDPRGLANLYRQASIGLVFSATNYSLIPNEMMACGLPVIELDVPSNQAEYPQGCLELVAPEPHSIKEGICRLLGDASRRAELSRRGLEWTKALSWRHSAELLEEAIRTRTLSAPSRVRAMGRFLIESESHIDTGNQGAVEVGSDYVESGAGVPKASIIIPTLNAGPEFAKVLEAIRGQFTPWNFEVVIVDSGSTDGTLEMVKEFSKQLPRTVLYGISKEDFGHGRTRNLGAQLSSGEFLVFITQDALPVGDLWLFELVNAVAQDKSIAGAFGRHIAYETADPFTKRDLLEHFEGLKAYPICNRNLDHARYLTADPGWRQILHFFSDNSSCLRRSAWQKFPYSDVPYGEDQVWAAIIIENGLSKAYAYDSVVYHSHDYDEAETTERAHTEAKFFRETFGYILCGSSQQMERDLAYLNDRDTRYAEERNIARPLLERRLKLNAARMRGHLLGSIAKKLEPIPLSQIAEAG